MIRRTAVVTLVLLSAMPALARRRAAVPRDSFPQCSMILGSGAVTFTRNDGLTLAPSVPKPRAVSHTYGVTVLPDQPETLYAWNLDDLFVSNDGGCTWRVAATIPGADFPPRLEAARGGRIYAWSDNRRFLVRYDSRGPAQLKPPVELIGLTVDAANGDRLRAGGVDGTIWESSNAGESWMRIGALENVPGYYRFAFDPKNLDHVVAGTLAGGAFVSRDGGKNWTLASGIPVRDTYVHSVLISPADANRVWAMAAGGSGRFIYVSSDGGATYEPAIEENAEVKLVNGPTMAAHPLNRDLLYFIFGTHSFDYGTDVFRFDLAAKRLTKTHNDHDEINAIVFSPKDPRVMYFGLEAVTSGNDEEQ